MIIPAAGLGTRMAPIPAGSKSKQKRTPPSKQFTELGGTPILVHTLRKFAAVDAVNEIWIALRENEIAGFRARLESEAKDVVKKKVELVAGGEHRQQSVANALNALSAAADDIVLVHDAVRPLGLLVKFIGVFDSLLSHLSAGGQQLAITEDGRQRVVQFVRDAGDQLPYGC